MFVFQGVEHTMTIRNDSTSSAGERVSIDFLDHNGTRVGYISVDTSGTCLVQVLITDLKML